MTWFLVDDGVDDSPELLAIPARYRMPALGLWTAIGVWMSKQHELFCPLDIIKKLGGTERLANELDACGLLLWDVRGTSGGLAYTGRRCRVKAPEQAQKDVAANAERVRRHRAKHSNGVDLQKQVDVMPLPPEAAEHYLAPRVGEVRYGGSETYPGPPKPTLRKPGTALESVDDSAWDLATSERGRSGPIKVGASRLVATVVPRNAVNDADRTILRIKASELLATETEDDVAECLRLWLQNERLGPAALGCCMAQVYKQRANGNLPKGVEKKMAGWLALGKELS